MINANNIEIIELIIKALENAILIFFLKFWECVKSVFLKQWWTTNRQIIVIKKYNPKIILALIIWLKSEKCFRNRLMELINKTDIKIRKKQNNFFKCVIPFCLFETYCNIKC